MTSLVLIPYTAHVPPSAAVLVRSAWNPSSLTPCSSLLHFIKSPLKSSLFKCTLRLLTLRYYPQSHCPSALFSSWYFLPLGILNSYVFYFVFVSPLAIHFVKVRILPVLFTAIFQHLEKCLAFTGLLADICWMNEWTLDCLYCDKWRVLMFAAFCWLYLCTFWTIVLWILSNLTVNSYMRRK